MPSSGIGSLASAFSASVASISCAMSRSSCRGWGPAAHRRNGVVVAVAEEPADHLAHLVDRLGAVEDGLVLRDVVVGRAHLDEVERAQLHATELLDLAVARQDARAVCAQLAVFHDDAELDGE